MIPPTWMTDHFDIYLTWDQLSLIIAILAALLLPVLSGAKLRAQQIKSLSNVKQLTLAGFIYSNDNGKNPAYYDTNYQGGGVWMGTLALSGKWNNVGVCPAALLRNTPPAVVNEL